MYVPGPTIGRALLGKRLEAHRKAAGLSPLDAARAIGDKTDVRIRHFGAGRRTPKFETVELLGQAYGLDREATAELQAMRAAASARSRWAAFGLTENATTYMGLEEDASELRTVEHVIVPGTLQTEAYMRRQFALGGLASEAVCKRVSARLLRQERLMGDDLRLAVVISEAALQRCAHEPEVGVSQLECLVDQGQRPNIKIHVLRFGVGLHAGMDGAFSLLRFPEGVLGDVAYVETVIGGQLIEDAPTVNRLDTLFGELHGQALDPNESLDWIAQLADKTRKLGRT